MPKTIHTVAINGQTFKRVSENRKYSHLVLGRPSYEYAFAYANRVAATDLRNFEYWRSVADGSHPHTKQSQWESDERYAERLKRDQAQAVEIIDGATTPEDYAQRKRQDRLDQLAERKQVGMFDKFLDLGWASRLDLAEKNASAQRKPNMAEVIIVPVERRVK